MSKGFISVVILVIAAIAVTLMPDSWSTDARRTAAVIAVQSGFAPTGAALLEPLAQAGDAIAQNDLGVLHMRGVGVARDPAVAAWFLNAAAESGLVRAKINLLLLRTPCDTSERNGAIARLEAFARTGDRRAASFAADCLIAFMPFNARIDETRRLLAMAEIATSTSDPDEELKFGWLLMKRVPDIEGFGPETDALKTRVALAAARYLLRAAEHGRPAAYEGISKIAAEQAHLLTDDTVSKLVAAKTASEWIEMAAQAGHPRSLCVVGVKFAKQLAEKKSRASDADRQKLADMFQTCLKDRDPRQVIFKDGKEQTVGHYRLFDVWMMDEAFLIASPRYDDYDHDIVAQEDAVRVIANLAKDL